MTKTVVLATVVALLTGAAFFGAVSLAFKNKDFLGNDNYDDYDPDDEDSDDLGFIDPDNLIDQA